MFIVGAAGYLYLTGNLSALLNSLKNLAYARLSNYDLVVIPLFLLMGQFATHGGLSAALFRFASGATGTFATLAYAPVSVAGAAPAFVALKVFRFDGPVIPFAASRFIFAIGVSHGAQKMNGIMQDIGRGLPKLVAARFTLDALPGKQMSIDADLNAGLIDEAEARSRRTAR